MKNAKIRAGIIIPLAMVVAGTLLQSIIGDFPLNAFRFPVNLIVIVELFAMTILLHWFFKDKSFIKFFSSGYAAISSLSLFSLLVIIMVLVPQDNSAPGIVKLFGLNSVIFTWTYAFATLYMLISLGLVTLRRLFPINLRNFFFFINHFGLFLVLATASLGQADKQRISITVPEGELVWFGYDEKGNYLEPDFAIKLNSFLIDFYAPKLAIVDNEGKMFKAKDYQPAEIIKGAKIRFKNHEIIVLDILENAIAVNDSVLFVAGLPEIPIVAVLLVDNDTILIQNSTSFHAPIIGDIADNVHLAILNPEPKYFGSDISLFTRDGIKDEKHLIEVNNPLIMNSWIIYQTSYFKSPEFEGYVSVFTAVFDPWLKIVYIGLALLFIGATYLIFSRHTLKKNKE